MECTVTKQGKALIAKIGGRLDTVTAPDFEQESRKWIEQGETFIVLDFSALEYISSAGLRCILTLAKALKPVRGTVHFCALQEMVREVFTISGFSSMFTLHESLEEALQG